MNKRFLTTLGAAAASLLLVLGVQQAVVLTSAAWTDQVNFSAPVSSGTWTTALAKLAFTDNRVENSAPTGVLRQVINVEHVYNGSNTPGAVKAITVTVTLHQSIFSGSPGNPTASGPWVFTGPPTKAGSLWTFTFTYTGPPLSLNASTGVGTLDFPVQCTAAKGKPITGTTTATSPQAVAPITQNYSATLPNWSC